MYAMYKFKSGVLLFYTIISYQLVNKNKQAT